MKKRVLLILFILVIISTGCTNFGKKENEKPDIYSRSIMVEGDVYTSTEKSILIVPFEDIIKDVTSQVDRTKLPKKEGEVNFSVKNGKYAKIDESSERDEKDYVAILIDSEWIKFIKIDK